MIRKFEFKNNYLSGDTNSLEAEYSSVGYFDGMDTRIIPNESAAQNFSAPMQSYFREDGIYEKCDHFTIIGIREEDEGDFWNRENVPFFVCYMYTIKKRVTFSG